MHLFNSNILEIIISIILIYALLSILVSIIVEARNYKTRARAKMLRESIIQLLRDPHNHEYGELFFNHFLISGLRSTANRPPQYISSSMFADVLIDIIAHQVEHERDIELVRTDASGKVYALKEMKEEDRVPVNLFDKFNMALEHMNPSPFRDLLISFCQKSEGKYEKLKPIIENWYNDYMDRVSGWYKTRLRSKFILYGFFVALLLNVDSIHLVRLLSLDNTLRTRLVSAAENMADTYSTRAAEEQSNNILISELYGTLPDSLKEDTTGKKPKDLLTFLKEKAPDQVAKRLPAIKDSVMQAYVQRSDSILSLVTQLNIPIGWSNEAAPYTWIVPDKKYSCTAISTGSGLMDYIEKRNHCPTFWTWFWYLVGIAITGISLSFGAPFWFELLIKAVNIRRAGTRPSTKTTDTKHS